jgi:restriction system protein
VRQEAGLRYHPALSPLAYERFCAARLTATGWRCQPAPRDSGADLLAQRGGLALAVLCRKSNALIPARMVEEAAVARARLGVDHVAIVSNAPYTRAALMQGDSTGALLLNHAELDLLEDGLAASYQGMPSGKRWTPSSPSGTGMLHSAAATGNAA